MTPTPSEPWFIGVGVKLWERFPGQGLLTQQLLDLVKAEGDDPDFADTKGFLHENPIEASNEHPLISLCGSIVRRNSCRDIASFIADSDERCLHWRCFKFRCSPQCRLLVAC